MMYKRILQVKLYLFILMLIYLMPNLLAVSIFDGISSGKLTTEITLSCSRTVGVSPLSGLLLR